MRKPLPPKRQTLAELRALQRLMATAVMRPLTSAQRMRPTWSDGSSTKQIAATFIKPNDRLSSFARLEIYNRQYWMRLIDCFYDDYPGLRVVLGEEGFANLAVAYLANHPSTSFTLRDLGQKLVAFIAAEPRWTSPHPDLACDMARLEWAQIEAFDNEARPAITASDLTGQNIAEIRLRLQPHITLLQLGFPLDDYLIALGDHGHLRGEASNAIEDGPRPLSRRKLNLPNRQTIRVAVHRHNNVVYFKRLQARQFDLISALQQGVTLQQALETLPQTATPPPIQRWFKTWSELGWFWM